MLRFALLPLGALTVGLAILGCGNREAQAQAQAQAPPPPPSHVTVVTTMDGGAGEAAASDAARAEGDAGTSVASEELAGPRLDAAIRALKPLQKTLDRCLGAGKPHAPNGKAVLAISLDAAGNVLAITAAYEESAVPAAVAACVAGQVKSVTFEKPSTAADATLRVPFWFVAANAYDGPMLHVGRIDPGY